MFLFLFMLIAAAAAIEYRSLSHAGEGVNCTLSPDRRLAEPGEDFQLRLRLENASRRFVPHVQIAQGIPQELVLPEEAENRAQTGRTRYLEDSTYLMPRQVWTRELRASLPVRGRYIFRGGSLHFGDFLGVKETAVSLNGFSEIVLVPKRADLGAMRDALGGFLGDESVRHFLYEDPVLTAGFSEYTGREPMKAISWTKSAVRGKLTVKQFDHTAELTANVLLCVEEGESALTERSFSLARSVCEFLEEKHLSYRFLTNADTAGAFSLWDCVEGGLGSAHLQTILEGLGRATTDPRSGFEKTLQKAFDTMDGGRMNIVILPSSEAAHRYAEGLEKLSQKNGLPSLLLKAEEAGL